MKGTYNFPRNRSGRAMPLLVPPGVRSVSRVSQRVPGMPLLVPPGPPVSGRRSVATPPARGPPGPAQRGSQMAPF